MIRIRCMCIKLWLVGLYKVAELIWLVDFLSCRVYKVAELWLVEFTR